jgi:hypothetical protein
MPMGEVPHDDELAPAATPGDAQFVALAQQPAGPRHSAVHLDLAALARRPRQGTGLEEAGDVEPHVQSLRS